MLSIHDQPARLCDGMSRREWMRVGGLGIAGLSLPRMLQAAATTTDPTFGRAKNVIFLYLAGGPPQHETFDPKPQAPVEIRGPFRPIHTNVPGIDFCELLPRTAQMADRLAVVRSMATDDNTHSSSSHWVLTGSKYQGPNPRTIQPTDWPYFGSLIKRYRPSDSLRALSAVWIPDIMRLNENVTPAGQTAGLMGGQWNPETFVGDPSQPDYRIEGLEPRGMPPLRITRRHSLLDQLQQHLRSAADSPAIERFDTYQQQAFDLMTSGRAQAAFALDREPPEMRERYGRNRWGQCVLLARRLIEAGVRLVHVQWPREPGDNAVDNPLWDTHAQNPDRLSDVLCPMFDVGFSALIEDLDQRGLLDETLVVAIGEFGRTPKINAKAGRDHWGPVFSFAMAGAGIRGGQVFGSSDRDGAYPKSDRVEPGHLTATIFHLVGIDPAGTFTDRQGRELPRTNREPIYPLVGTEPATSTRRPSTGDLYRVPPFDPDRLLNDARFAGDEVIRHVSQPSRPRGWQVSPRIVAPGEAGFGVRLYAADARRRLAPQHVAIGFDTRSDEPVVAAGAHAMLAQEVRSPFAGRFRLGVRLAAGGTSRDFFDQVFQKRFRCRLIFFQFSDAAKQADQRRELASFEFTPPWQDRLLDAPRDEDRPLGALPLVEFTQEFLNPRPGANFSFGLGLGVAVLLEHTANAPLHLKQPQRVMLHITAVELEFQGKPRNEKVVV